MTLRLPLPSLSPSAPVACTGALADELTRSNFEVGFCDGIGLIVATPIPRAVHGKEMFPAGNEVAIRFRRKKNCIVGDNVFF